MGKADISSKYVLAGEPGEWVGWLLQDATVEVEERLSGEFRFLLRQSDELFRVRGREGVFVLVVEVQLRVDPRIPQRMRAYAALAEEQYDLPVYPVVLYLLPSGAGRALPGAYHSEFMGLMAHQDVRVLAVWELEARRVLEEGIVALIPFVPLMKGADAETIRAGVRLLRERAAGEEAEVALALFASFVMNVEQVKRIVRWDMAVLRESPWYREIVLEGRQQGVLEGRRQDIVRLLQVRFDPIGPRLAAVAEQLATLDDAERLQELLVRAVRADSVEDFLAHLKS